jgi:hypothetical protein
VVFFYLLLNFKQKKLMIEKGIFKKIEFDIDAFSLFTGLLLFCIGVSLVVFFAVKDGVSYGFLSGLIPLATGLSLLLFFIIRKGMNKKSDETSPGT